eukprot:scaffold245_cov256-Pinguiococcus_pyrenoidosus.AAC.8
MRSARSRSSPRTFSRIIAGIAGEGRAVVHFDYPRLQRAVDEDVEPKNFEAAKGVHRSFALASDAAAVDVCENWLHGNERLVNNVADSLPKQRGIMTAALQPFHEP